MPTERATVDSRPVCKRQRDGRAVKARNTFPARTCDDGCRRTCAWFTGPCARISRARESLITERHSPRALLLTSTNGNRSAARKRSTNWLLEPTLPPATPTHIRPFPSASASHDPKPSFGSVPCGSIVRADIAVPCPPHPTGWNTWTRPSKHRRYTSTR